MKDANKQLKPKALNKGDDGFSLIAICILIVVVSSLSMAGLSLYKVWKEKNNEITTQEKMDYIQDSLQFYMYRNGSYPCPAAFDAGLDTANFGLSVAADCSDGTAGNVGTSTFRAAGRDGRMVRTGTVPVRTLGIPDDYMFDAYGKRLIFSVTEIYAVQGTLAGDDLGAIAIQDSNGNDATSVAGNVVEIVYSMGKDNNGAYNQNGVLLQACDTTVRSGENCDFGTDAVFTNSLNTSQREDNLLDQRISFAPPKTVIACDDSSLVVPGRTAYVVDTSGSMAWAGQCPDDMPGCSRMDVAKWALRRSIPTRVYSNTLIDDPGETYVTGFVGVNTVSNVTSRLSNILFNDPTAENYEAPQEMDLLEDVEDKLGTLCPSGGTPIGIHMLAMAQQIGDGTEERPNKITILTDGQNTNGVDPVTAARQLQSSYPYIEVDVIDVTGTPSLENVAAITNGDYYLTSNPEELLEALEESTGACSSYSPPPLIDKRSCGSTGNWW